METEEGMTKLSAAKSRLKKGAIVSLVVLSLYICGEVLSIYRTKYQLESPFIPERVIGEINKQFIFKGIVASLMFVIALVLYFFERYLFVIILVIVKLIAGRYIYI
jgi:uncharacterized membrane protein